MGLLDIFTKKGFEKVKEDVANALREDNTLKVIGNGAKVAVASAAVLLGLRSMHRSSSARDDISPVVINNYYYDPQRTTKEAAKK